MKEYKIICSISLYLHERKNSAKERSRTRKWIYKYVSKFNSIQKYYNKTTLWNDLI